MFDNFKPIHTEKTTSYFFRPLEDITAYELWLMLRYLGRPNTRDDGNIIPPFLIESLHPLLRRHVVVNTHKVQFQGHKLVDKSEVLESWRLDQ